MRGDNGGGDTATACVRTGGGRDCASLAAWIGPIPPIISRRENKRKIEDIEGSRRTFYMNATERDRCQEDAGLVMAGGCR